MNSMMYQSRDRCLELDWLRIGAVLLLIAVHTAAIFDPFPPTAVKGQASELLKIFAGFVHLWRLAVLFIISGAGASFALRRQRGPAFLRMRLRRIGVPLVFGTLFIVPVQLYYWCDRIYPGRYVSYLDFYSQLLNAASHGLIASKPEYLYWAHLWFLGYLLIYSVITVPFFRYVKSERGAFIIAGFSRIVQMKGAIFFLVLPLLISELTLRPSWSGFEGPNFIGDWANVSAYLIYYVYGFLIYSDPRLRHIIAGWRYRALALAIVTSILFFVVPRGIALRAMGYNLPWFLFLSVRLLNGWFCIITVFAFGIRLLQRSNPALSRANEAVYPVYVVHLPLSSIIAFHVVRWPLPVLVQFAIIVAATAAASFLIYKTLIAPMNVTRFLFGLKLRKVVTEERRILEREVRQPPLAF